MEHRGYKIAYFQGFMYALCILLYIHVQEVAFCVIL
jgi:hypothetical protein